MDAPRTRRLATLWFLLAAAPAGAQTPFATGPEIGPMPAADRAAIDAILANEITQWNRADAALYAKDVRPDCVFTNTVGMVAVGRPAFQAQHKLIFATIYKGSRVDAKITHLRLLAPTVAVLDTDARVAGGNWLPPGALVIDGAIFSRLEQVLVKVDGRWGITSYHNVFVAAQR